MSKICCVVPSIRPESLKIFMERWDDLFKKHEVQLLAVIDGDYPSVKAIGKINRRFSLESIMGDYKEVIYNKSDCVRNLGFAFVAKSLPEVEYIYTLDDDVYPDNNDPIQEHLDALNLRVPVSWLSTASEYMRGFPYAVRNEAEVVLSHGVWNGVRDYDAPTQLVNGNRLSTFYKGPIPKGIYYPMCIMNVMFKRKMLPYMYQAPGGYKTTIDRFGDIFCGIESKREIDNHGWAVVSGYSTVWHDRASNVFTNLVKEARGIGLNETFYLGDEKDAYFIDYKQKLGRWQDFLKK